MCLDREGGKTLLNPGFKTYGQFYVVKYDNGLIKVGKSQNARGRIRYLRGDQFKPGRVVDSWHSEEHEDWLLNELRMLVFCHERFGHPATGFETFWGDYEPTLAYAQSLTIAAIAA
jgi:hypothetical protein